MDKLHIYNIVALKPCFIYIPFFTVCQIYWLSLWKVCWFLDHYSIRYFILIPEPFRRALYCSSWDTLDYWTCHIMSRRMMTFDFLITVEERLTLMLQQLWSVSTNLYSLTNDLRKCIFFMFWLLIFVSSVTFLLNLTRWWRSEIINP